MIKPDKILSPHSNNSLIIGIIAKANKFDDKNAVP
jgi:hypothetical protein